MRNPFTTITTVPAKVWAATPHPVALLRELAVEKIEAAQEQRARDARLQIKVEGYRLEARQNLLVQLNIDMDIATHEMLVAQGALRNNNTPANRLAVYNTQNNLTTLTDKYRTLVN